MTRPLSRTTRMRCVVLIAVTGILVSPACKGEPTVEEPPAATNLITISGSSVVNPKNIVISRGSQVTFTNNDSRAHDMQSDPHPEHNDCPELAQVGYLRPGESRTSGNLNIARTCGFHDNQNEGVLSLRGTIVIQ